jgi:hypothetical protein
MIHGVLVNRCEGDHEEQEADHSEDHQRQLVALGIVAAAEMSGHRQREARHDELAGECADESIGVEARPFIAVRGHHRAERGVGQVDRRVGSHQ